MSLTPAKLGNIPSPLQSTESSDYRKQVQQQQERAQKQAQARELEQQSKLQLLSAKAKELTSSLSNIIMALSMSLGARPGNQVFQMDRKIGTVADHRHFKENPIPENERQSLLLRPRKSLQEIQLDTAKTLSKMSKHTEEYELLSVQKERLDKRLKPVFYTEYEGMTYKPIPS